ncbi:MAG: nucleotide exchange factor GrpE [Bacteroidales bacterium]|nr:nucleotide exchange factor GrpE [Bacteroidales bacterium]
MSRRNRHHHSNNKGNNMENNNMEQNPEQTQETEKETQEPTETAKSAETDTEKTSQAETADKSTEENSQDSNDLQKKYDELNDRYLRLMAEFDNYRKRTLKEKMDLTKYAEEDVLKGILPVVDNMERAIKSLETAKDLTAVSEGIDLIYKKFQSFLESRGIKEIEALNKELDTDLHEAVTKFAAPSEDLKGKIIDVIEKGYYLHDKVIRYAKVVVGE